MLKNVVGLRKGTLDIAAAQVEVEGDIGIAASSEMLKISEGTGWAERFMDIDGRGQGLYFIKDRG
jgi:hypothetical protein